MQNLVTIDDIIAAERAIDGAVVRTPAIKSPALGAKLGARVALKLELLQKTGCLP